MDRLGAPRAEGEIIFARAALVRVAFDREGVTIVLIEPCRLLVERRLGGRGEIGLIGVEEDAVADRLVEFLDAARARRAIARGEVVVGVVVRAGAKAKPSASAAANAIELRALFASMPPLLYDAPLARERAALRVNARFR